MWDPPPLFRAGKGLYWRYLTKIETNPSKPNLKKAGEKVPGGEEGGHRVPC